MVLHLKGSEGSVTMVLDSTRLGVVIAIVVAFLLVIILVIYECTDCCG
jgi:hypothetical protein